MKANSQAPISKPTKAQQATASAAHRAELHLRLVDAAGRVTAVKQPLAQAALACLRGVATADAQIQAVHRQLESIHAALLTLADEVYEGPKV
jgi:hypothetical protein